jgi:uncharacterized pyridoxal phosphate-containing UPF0001 family protein
VRWHYLGAVQRNKAALISRHADVIESVARAVEVDALAARPERREIYVEVDYTEIPGRTGARPEQIEVILARARERGLQVRGLMTVAPPDREGATVAFASLVRDADRFGLAERSMGMSDDYELATRMGSTEVRIGRALFGPRPPRPSGA